MSLKGLPFFHSTSISRSLTFGLTRQFGMMVSKSKMFNSYEVHSHEIKEVQTHDKWHQGQRGKQEPGKGFNLTEIDLRLSSTRRYKLKGKGLGLRSKREMFPEVESSLYRLHGRGSTARREDGVTTISQAEKHEEP